MKKKFYCESCKHIAKENGKILENPALDIDLDSPVFCDICGQELFPDLHNQSLETKEIDLVKSALNNKNLHVICFTAPSIRSSIGEAFGLNEDCQGKLISALKLLGFDNVFDMNIAADFTTVEEANEFMDRLKNNHLPMFTSCCPGWVNYVEKLYPEFSNNLSSCKSPQQMFGALINNIYAKSINKKSTELFVVSIVPCVVKRLERICKDMNTAIGYDVDACLTTKQVAQLIIDQNIDFNTLPNSTFDTFFGESTGAGVIFGNTGGVMNAVLGGLGEKDCNKQISKINTELKSGKSGIKTGSIKIANHTIKIAIASGLNHARTLLEELKLDPHKYDFIEVMACPGGCVGGGGQIDIWDTAKKEEVLTNRAKILYNAAKTKQLKHSKDNPALKNLYKNHLGHIGSDTAQSLLHIKR